ncbi:MAG: hypothetical protein IJD82_01265 [Clostridia bacterium]|nr:hypothetical protein [Clostridia bacterium]
MKKALFTIVALSALALLASCTGDTQDASSTSPTEQTSMAVSSEESSADESSVEESSAVESSEAESSVEDSSEDEESSELAELNYVGVNSYIDSSYDAEDSKVLSAVYGEQYAVCFPDWEQYAVIDGELICAAVTGNTALGFGYEKGETHPDGYSLYNIRLYRFAKGSDEVEESTIELPKGCIYHMMFYSAITRDSGYLAVFETEYESSQRHILSYLLFTADGGKTWQTVDTVPLTSDPNDYPLMVRFVDENTGVLSFSYQNTESAAERTYITTDGGKTWSFLQGLTDIEHEEGSEAVDFSSQGGVYTLTLRTPPENTQCYQYVSADLQSWTLLPEELDGCEFKRFDAEVGIFEGADDGNHVIYVTEWDALYTVAGTGYDYLQYYRAGNSLFVFSAHGADNPDAFVLYRLDKGKTDAQTVDLGLPENFANIGCKLQVFDDDSALFVLTEYAEHRAKMYAVFKTTDGGKTWQSIGKQLDETRWPLYEGISKLHFFDEQNGILFREFTDTEYLGDRVLVTTDGGATWFNPEITPDGAELDGADIAEMSFGDGKYTFLIKQYADGDDDAYATFMSDDLVHWELSED